MKERQEIRYKQKHLKSQSEFEREQKFYEQKKMELRIEFDEIDQGYGGQGQGDGFIEFQEIENHLIRKNRMQPEEARQLAQEIMDNFDEN